MRFVGVLILIGLLECLFVFALYWPTPRPDQIGIATTVIGGWVGPPVPIVKELEYFGQFVACPLVIIAAYLIGQKR